VDIADAPEDMASRIVRLLRDPQFSREKGREARRQVAVEYNWDRWLDRFLRVLEHSGKEEAAQAPVFPPQ
jgi:glycosyltransferase involved in cell wall biosynthesis